MRWLTARLARLFRTTAEQRERTERQANELARLRLEMMRREYEYRNGGR